MNFRLNGNYVYLIFLFLRYNIYFGWLGFFWYFLFMLVYFIFNIFIVIVILGDFNVREVSLIVDLGVLLIGYCIV